MSVIIAHKGKIIARDFMTSYPSGEPAWKPGVEVPSGSAVGLQWSGSINDLFSFITWYGRDDAPEDVRLVIPFLPCSRQDKPQGIEGDQSGGVDSVLSLICAWCFLGRDRLTIADNHSIGPLDSLAEYMSIDVEHLCVTDIGVMDTLRAGDFDLVVAPDHGARERADLVAEVLGCPLLVANKTRDQATGRITSYTLDAPDGDHGWAYKPSNILVVDDIIDGGGTFALLGQELEMLWPNARRTLYTTHGVLGPQIPPRCIREYSQFIMTDSCANAEKFRANYPQLVTVIPILERLTLERSFA